MTNKEIIEEQNAKMRRIIEEADGRNPNES